MKDLVFESSDISLMITVIESTGHRHTFSKRIVTATKGFWKDEFERRLFQEYKKSNPKVIKVCVR